MSLFLENMSMLNNGFNLSNTNDVVADSYSVIQGNEITDVLDLIGSATTGPAGPAGATGEAGTVAMLATSGLILTTSGLVSIGRIYNAQHTPVALNTAGTITITAAQIIVGIFVVTQTAAVSLTLPTGQLIHNDILGGATGAPELPGNQSIDWSVINLGSSAGATTVQATGVSGHTLVGSWLVAIGTSVRFRTRLSATNTAITYRLS